MKYVCEKKHVLKELGLIYITMAKKKMENHFYDSNFQAIGIPKITFCIYFSISNPRPLSNSDMFFFLDRTSFIIQSFEIVEVNFQVEKTARFLLDWDYIKKQRPYILNNKLYVCRVSKIS